MEREIQTTNKPHLEPWGKRGKEQRKIYKHKYEIEKIKILIVRECLQVSKSMQIKTKNEKGNI